MLSWKLSKSQFTCFPFISLKWQLVKSLPASVTRRTFFLFKLFSTFLFSPDCQNKSSTSNWQVRFPRFTVYERLVLCSGCVSWKTFIFSISGSPLPILQLHASEGWEQKICYIAVLQIELTLTFLLNFRISHKLLKKVRKALKSKGARRQKPDRTDKK